VNDHFVEYVEKHKNSRMPTAVGGTLTARFINRSGNVELKGYSLLTPSCALQIGSWQAN
jgi:hypothetical protein